MGLVFSTAPSPVSPPPASFVSPVLVGPKTGFKVSLPTFAVAFVVTPVLPGKTINGKVFNDFPATPKAPSVW